MDTNNTEQNNDTVGNEPDLGEKTTQDEPDTRQTSNVSASPKKQKRSILALISFLLGIAYTIFLISYFSSSDNLGAGIAAALVMPHMVAVIVATIFNGLGFFLKNRNFMLVAGILYSVSIVLFPMYFMFVIIQTVLSFIAFARMGKNNYIEEDVYMEKVKKPFYKKWWFWVIIVVIVIGALGGDSDNTDTKDKQEPVTVASDNKAEETQAKKDDEVKEEKVKEEKKDDVPKEFSSALKKAETYSETMHMSKASIHNQLTSEYGEKFSKEAADYAMENLQADWKLNALEKAKTYQDTMDMSPEAIRDQLTSEYGEQFTQEEADWAIDNLPQ